MRKIEALGVIETLYFAVAMELLDDILKIADVEFLHKESALGGKLVTLFISGSVANVATAIEHINMLKSTSHSAFIKNGVMITKPHEGILEYILLNEEDNDNGSDQKDGGC